MQHYKGHFAYWEKVETYSENSEIDTTVVTCGDFFGKIKRG